MAPARDQCQHEFPAYREPLEGYSCADLNRADPKRSDSARRLPSQVIGANWSRNEEWRDRFVTGLDVTAYDYDEDTSITGRVDLHLRSLYQAEQTLIYNSLLRPGSPGAAAGSDSLHELLQRLTASKSLLRSSMNLFYP